MRRTLVNIVKARFPDLPDLAQQKTQQVDNPGTLDQLVEQISAAPDEDIVRALLGPINS